MQDKLSVYLREALKPLISAPEAPLDASKAMPSPVAAPAADPPRQTLRLTPIPGPSYRLNSATPAADTASEWFQSTTLNQAERHIPQRQENRGMSWRFRRRLRIIPGVTLNVGKRGISVSIGGRGAHVTYGRRGRRGTIGLPGTGLSYTAYESYRRTGVTPDPARRPSWTMPLILIVVMLGLVLYLL
jgi:hypothetical protein